jgi:hypothetical protein
MSYLINGNYIENFAIVSKTSKTSKTTTPKTTAKIPQPKTELSAKTPKISGKVVSNTGTMTAKGNVKTVGPSAKIVEFECKENPWIQNEPFQFNKNIVNNFTVDSECLLLPGRVWNGEGKRNFIVTSADPGCDPTDTNSKCAPYGFHGYEMYLINPDEKNIIFVNIIKPNFYCIVNTSYMTANGTIKFQTSANNENMRFVLINNLNDNDTFIINRDDYGNICRDPDDEANPNRYDFSLDPENESLREINYSGNPRIYFMGDYLACDKGKMQDIINVFVYIDNGDTPKLTTKCLGKLKLPNSFSDATKSLSLKLAHHGYIFNNYTSRSIVLDFNPKDFGARDPYLVIINTLKNKEQIQDEEEPRIGMIEFNDQIIKKLMEKAQCYYIQFWLSSFDLPNNNKPIVDIKNRTGPYKSISFAGRPKIIIYIPPYVFNPLNTKNITKTSTPVTTVMTLDEIKTRKEIHPKRDLLQENVIYLDVYVNIIYEY